VFFFWHNGAMLKPTPPTLPIGDPRADRKRAATDHRRKLILDAAKEVFQEHGLDGASMREIAKKAGYTPGAIYLYYRSKEEIYGELLAGSLERLNEAVHGLDVTGASAGDRLRAAALAFYRFYADHPRDLDLGFYLFHGLRPHGLTKELNSHLNDRLRAALQPVELALAGLGVAPEVAAREVTALFGHCVGLLLLQHTGRIRIFDQRAQDLFEEYVGRLQERYRPQPAERG
jgi:AcrR family transcriptional regulator